MILCDFCHDICPGFADYKKHLEINHIDNKKAQDQIAEMIQKKLVNDRRTD